MTDAEHGQYFAQRPTVPSDPVEIGVEVRGRRLRFVTDRGVFSHGRVDTGSRLLAEQVRLPDSGEFLDWGCAWGLVGVVAASARPRLQVTLVDVNERACELARENLRRNAVEGEVVCGDAAQVLGERQFDVIAANPPLSAGRAAVLALFDHAARALRPGGSFWTVVATKKGAKTLARELEARFAQVEQTAMRGGYRVYRAEGPIDREADDRDR